MLCWHMICIHRWGCSNKLHVDPRCSGRQKSVDVGCYMADSKHTWKIRLARRNFRVENAGNFIFFHYPSLQPLNPQPHNPNLTHIPLLRPEAPFTMPPQPTISTWHGRRPAISHLRPPLLIPIPVHLVLYATWSPIPSPSACSRPNCPSLPNPKLLSTAFSRLSILCQHISCQLVICRQRYHTASDAYVCKFLPRCSVRRASLASDGEGWSFRSRFSFGRWSLYKFNGGSHYLRMPNRIRV